MTSRRWSSRLTGQALRQQERVHPRLQATSTPRSHTTPLTDRSKDHTQTPSGADPVLQRTAGGVGDGGDDQQAMKRHALTVFRLVTATRSWQRYRRRNTGPSVPVLYDNTYRLGPERGARFSAARVEDVLREVLTSRLQHVTYTADQCRRHSMELVSVIKARTKNLRFPRYKLVVNVLLMENKGQGVRVVSRGLTNTDTDSFATYTFQSPSLVAVAYVHGVYYE